MRLFRRKAKVDPARLKALLLDVVDCLDAAGIGWHLEGGTLLGLVRDGMLLPWDPDADVSVMREDLDGRMRDLRARLRARGWRVSLRRYGPNQQDYAPDGSVRILKVKGRSRWWLTPDAHVCDIIVKTRHDGFVWWQAKGCTMRVDQAHYAGHEVLDWEGRRMRLPMDHRAYLTAKYGDWSIPVKDWSARDELTVVGRIRQD